MASDSKSGEGIAQPSKIAGWPVKDLVEFAAAGFVAFGIGVVITGNVTEGAAVGVLGGVWYFLGVIFGYSRGQSL